MWPHSCVTEDCEVICKCLEVRLCPGKLNIYGLSPIFNANHSKYVTSNFQQFKFLKPEINLSYIKKWRCCRTKKNALCFPEKANQLTVLSVDTQLAVL
jgi:hypothetical protein